MMRHRRVSDEWGWREQISALGKLSDNLQYGLEGETELGKDHSMALAELRVRYWGLDMRLVAGRMRNRLKV